MEEGRSWGVAPFFISGPTGKTGREPSAAIGGIGRRLGNWAGAGEARGGGLRKSVGLQLAPRVEPEEDGESGVSVGSPRMR